MPLPRVRHDETSLPARSSEHQDDSHNDWTYITGSAHDECLNINSFYSLLHAQVVIGDWKVEYNTVRRHSALGYLTPADYARHCTHEMEPDDSHRDRT